MVLRRRFIVREWFAVFPGNPFTPGIYIGPPFVQSSSPDSSLSVFTASYPSSLSLDILALKPFIMPLHSLSLVSILLPNILMPGKCLCTFYLAQRWKLLVSCQFFCLLPLPFPSSVSHQKALDSSHNTDHMVVKQMLETSWSSDGCLIILYQHSHKVCTVLTFNDGFPFVSQILFESCNFH